MRRRKGKGGEGELEVKVPSFFRCPISLDVMRSPVSLCTGVTYDRSSIQAWLDTGHNTCPATMQLLPSTDFVPNLTLLRLIHHWSSPSPPRHLPPTATATTSSHDLVRRLPSSADPLPLLRDLADDESRIHDLAGDPACLPALHGVLVRKGLELEAMEAAARVLSAVLVARRDGAGAEIADPRSLASLVAVLRRGRLESRIAAARAVESIASAGTPESKVQIAESEGMLAALLGLASDGDGGEPADPAAADAGLSSLAAVASLRRVRPQIVALGAVPALGKLLARASTPAAAAEKALRLMGAASACTEGRAAICEDPAAVAAVVGRMTRVAAGAGEHAVAALWGVCCVSRDRRAQEAVAGGEGLAKILLLMQSGCSPAARRMAIDLLKILSGNSKGCLPSYDSKTTHIAPF